VAHPPSRRTVPALAVSATLLLGGTVVVPLAYADGHDNLKQRQHKVHRHVRHAQGDVHESSKALAHARARLSGARHRLHAAERELASTRKHLRKARAVDHRMRRKLAKAERVLAEAQAEVERSRAAVAEQQRAIGNLALENYQNGDPQLLGLVAMLGSGDPREVTTQLNAVHGVMARQSSTLDDLEAEKEHLVEVEAKVQRVQQRVERRREAARANLERKRTLKRSAKAQRGRVAELVHDRRAAKRKAGRIKARDLRQLRRLQRKEARIQRQILARARHRTNRSVSNTSSMLFRPVPGYVTSPYGYRTHPIYGYYSLHDGTDFHAPCGTPLRAAETGRVISTYYSSVWGNRLYLDLGRINGHSFTVIYNHLSSYRVRAGATVARGDVVGYAGTTGWSTGCHLHFTVLRDGNTVNPMNYM
jgi:murein DD-endopeptidase MepM/ murein hydrolase activator NlpD